MLGQGGHQGADLLVDPQAQRVGEAPTAQVVGDFSRPADTVGAYEDPVADGAATLGSGQGPLGVADQGDVVVSVVHPGVTRSHE